jgi:hypothetical protein
MIKPRGLGWYLLLPFLAVVIGMAGGALSAYLAQ